MEKDVKVSELAQIWGVSVPTTWNRIRKEGLETFLKKDENGKEVNYIKVSEVIVKKYINNLNNSPNEVNNNGYYEEVLRDNNVNEIQKNNNDSISASELFDKLTTLNNEYNDRLERLNNELLISERQRLLLEDKAGREGLYLNQINELKDHNNRLLSVNKRLFITLIVLITILITIITTISIVNNHTNEENTKKIPAQQEELAKPVKK